METKEIIVIAPKGTHLYSFYLTDGKEYKAYDIDEKIFKIKNDDGDELICSFIECAHLQNNDWIIKNTKMKPQTEILLKFCIALIGFSLFFLMIGLSDYVVGKLAYLIAEKQNFIIFALSGIVIAFVVVKTYLNFKK